MIIDLVTFSRYLHWQHCLKNSKTNGVIRRLLCTVSHNTERGISWKPYFTSRARHADKAQIDFLFCDNYKLGIQETMYNLQPGRQCSRYPCEQEIQRHARVYPLFH